MPLVTPVSPRRRLDAPMAKLTTPDVRALPLDACRHAATAYEAGDGVPRDLARAADLSRAACKLGADDGCEAFARLQNRAATVDETGTTTSPASEDPAGEGELESEGTKRRGP